MRATPRKFIKSLFLISISGFLIVNMNLFLQAGIRPPEGSEANPSSDGVVLPFNHRATNKSAPLSKDESEVSKIKFPHLKSKERTENVLDTSELNASRIKEIKGWIKEANVRQKMLNVGEFDLTSSKNTVVIVVQVHNRVEYLQHLIDSLRKARYIEHALLIFSHDYYSEDLNRMVETVDFCLALQIFYPFSMQLHPHEFPGEDPGDCPRNVNKQQALQINCNNAKYPDKYGHYREAKYSQTKHHWFWKINHVFDHLNVMKNFNGPVLFLEEDHYVVEDFIHVLLKMYRFKEQACKDCSIFTIGTYDKRPSYGNMAQRGLFGRLFNNQADESRVDRVDVLNWISSKHNMGMSVNREVWRKIKTCAAEFCSFDDYNWDWSLQRISMACIPDKLRVMVVKSPRTFHIGECGVHHKGKNCNPSEQVRQIEDLLKNNQKFLYPDSMAVHSYPRTPSRMPKPNGGWGDIRDHQLCTSFTRDEAHR